MSLEKVTQDLIAAIRAGDSGAKESLVERFLILEVDDVFQETFAKAFQSIDTFRWQGVHRGKPRAVDKR